MAVLQPVFDLAFANAIRALEVPRDRGEHGRMESAVNSRPEVTAALARGVQRLMLDHGFAPVLEAPLGNGRRADVLALGPKGELWIIETKSCLADFATDQKWPDYQDYCDAFYFAVTENFPHAALPDQAGLIVADAFGGAIVRAAPASTLAGARRKAMTLMFARLAAARLAYSLI